MEIAEIIRRWHGGMGSFSDICLGETKEEHQQFYDLQNELYNICLEIIYEQRGVISAF